MNKKEGCRGAPSKTVPQPPSNPLLLNDALKRRKAGHALIGSTTYSNEPVRRVKIDGVLRSRVLEAEVQTPIPVALLSGFSPPRRPRLQLRLTLEGSRRNERPGMAVKRREIPQPLSPARLRFHHATAGGGPLQSVLESGLRIASSGRIRYGPLFCSSAAQNGDVDLHSLLVDKCTRVWPRRKPKVQHIIFLLFQCASKYVLVRPNCFAVRGAVDR